MHCFSRERGDLAVCQPAEEARFLPSVVANVVCHWRSVDQCFPLICGVRLLPSTVANVVSYRHVSKCRRPTGFAWQCATPGCPYQVHSCDELGGYCCAACFESGSSDLHHGWRCEKILAPLAAARADTMWSPHESDALTDLELAWMSAEDIEHLLAAAEDVEICDVEELQGEDLKRVVDGFLIAAESIEPILINARELSEVSPGMLGRAAYRYVELRYESARAYFLQHQWESVVQLATAVLAIDTANENAQQLLMLSISYIEAEILDTDERLSNDCVIVPMGHYCPTAWFLKSMRWRRWSFPLDYSAHTFKVWRHMLSDDFATLLKERSCVECEAHPYNSKFQDVAMFIHQSGWANEETFKRVERLKGYLADNQVFGFAMYFEGKLNVHAQLEEVISDAKALAEAHWGFSHIVLVWFERQTSNPPNASWTLVSERLSVLVYMPVQQMNHWDTLHPDDVHWIAALLRGRFPHVFDYRDHGSALPEEGWEEVTPLESKDREGYWDRVV